MINRGTTKHEAQIEVCKKWNVPFVACVDGTMIGVAKNIKSGIMPVNGLRHPIQGRSNGWYIWAGQELKSDSDFFQPLHVDHISKYCSSIIKYLGLPPGWRFLIDENGYEDVWYDASLLNVSYGLK